MFRPCLLASAAALCLAVGAVGQEPEDDAREAVTTSFTPLPIVEVTGLRAQTPGEIAASVTTLDADLLAVRDAPYLADQLRTVPGVGISRSGAAGALTQVRIRGAEANHTLALIDGFEISDPTTGETDFGLISGLYPARVEVARGEQSALYGSDAIGGVVNIVTGETPGARGILEGGSDATYRLDAAYGLELDEGFINFAFADVISDGVDTSGRGGETDGFQNYSGLVSGGVNLGNDWRASGLVRYGYGEVDTDPDLDFDGRLDNADRVTESDQWTLGTVLQGDGFGLNHLLSASFNRVERENFADRASSDSTTGERTKLVYSPSWQRDDLRLTGLIDFEQEVYERVGEASFFGDPNQSQRLETLGLAGEAIYTPGDWTLNASARRDDNDGLFEDATTWRLGAAYDFGDGRLRASAGTGVKNPTFVELFGFFPGSFIGNPDLVPEESISWEIGWDHDFGPVQTTLTYFEADLTDEIFTAFNPDFTSTARNRRGESERSGVEASARWVLSDTLSAYASASNITSDNAAGAREIRVPDWTGSLSLDWQPEGPGGPRAGFGADYVGAQLDTDFGTFSQVELDAYWLVSATVEYPVTQRFAITLRGANLLDEEVVDVFGFNGPGAQAFIGVRLR